MKNNIFQVFIAIVIVINSLPAQGLDPSWKKSVVVVEQQVNGVFQPVATGFVVLFQNIPFLVTNNHVVQNSKLFFRFNPKPPSNVLIRLSVDTLIAYNNIPWGISPKYDIAAIPLFFYPSIERYSDSVETKSFGISMFKDWDYVNEGDEVFVLGFPLGVGASYHYSPVYRSGTVALKEEKGNYLIDSKIFPGNSGGPVFMKPSIYNYRTGSLGEGTVGYLVGIVSAYLPYIDVAISSQTKRPRITFEENSGLAIVYSTETIIELLSTYIKQYNIK